MLWEVLIIGSFWFYALAFGLFVFLVCLTESEKGTWGAITLICTAGIIQLFSDFSVFGWLWDNPLWACVYFGGYFVVGAIWATIKWTLFSRNLREKYDEAKEEWLEPERLKSYAQRLKQWANKENNNTYRERYTRWATALENAATENAGELTDTLKPAWTHYRANPNAYRYDHIAGNQENEKPIEIPHPKHHKSKIYRWIGHWPWSLFWTFLNDPIRKICKAIYKRMSIIFVSIAQKAFKGIEDDFVVEDED